MCPPRRGRCSKRFDARSQHYEVRISRASGEGKGVAARPPWGGTAVGAGEGRLSVASLLLFIGVYFAAMATPGPGMTP